MTKKSLITHPIAPGYELLGDDGSKRSICPKAEFLGVTDDFRFEIDHGDAFDAELVGSYVDNHNLPVLEWNTETINWEDMKGTSPLLADVFIDETTGLITKYKISGLSVQIDQNPVCPADTCPTEFKGGKKVTKDEEETTEDVEDTEETEEIEEEPEDESEEPKKKVKKVKKKKAEKAPESRDRDEYIAKLIRENEGLKKRHEEMQKVLDDINAEKRKELVELVPEEHREYADGLEMEALQKVVAILGEKEKAEKDKVIVEGAGEETTDQKPDTEKTKGSEDPYKGFFDRSDVLKALEK
jgi:hypothetical protein